MQSVCGRGAIRNFMIQNRSSRPYSWLEKRQIAPPLEPKVVQFSVPWGHISGKAWGSPTNKPVLALHGWLDNAGSFDRLAPLMASDLYVVAMDFPGHGLSSHRPRGFIHNVYHYATDIKYMVDALKWDKFSLLGHSMGAGAATWFSGILPDMVDCLVLLEEIGVSTVAADDVPVYMRQNLVNLDKMNYVDTKTYPNFEAVVERMAQGRIKVDKNFEKEINCVRDLCIRGAERLDDGTYKLTRDAQLNLPPMPKATEAINMAFIKAIQCPILIIMSDAPETAPWMDTVDAAVAQLRPEQVSVIRESGGHHLLMYAAERLYGHISSFFKKMQ